MALAEDTGLISFPDFGAAIARLCAGLSTRCPQEMDQSSCRDFVSEKLWENPDAFCSEHDVQAMMSHFPGDF